MKYLLFRASVLAVAVLLASASAEAAPAKPKSYDGIVTQINLSDGSFVLRLRDGSSVTVKNPIIPNLFLTVKGILDAGVISEVSEMKMKSAAAVDAIPSISFLDPGSGQVGT